MWRSRRLGVESYDLHPVTGIALAQRGEFEAAIRHLRRAVQLRPEFAQEQAEVRELHAEGPDRPRPVARDASLGLEAESIRRGAPSDGLTVGADGAAG